MPLIDFDDEKTWREMYSASVDGGERAGFGRDAKPYLMGHAGWQLMQNLAALGMTRSDRVLLVGAAFGFLAEDFIANGYEGTVACDRSKWVHANKGGHAAVDVVDADVLFADDRERLGSFDWCVTEDVITTLSDVEAVRLAEACRLLAPCVAHWTTACQKDLDLAEFRSKTVHPYLNWKKIDDWRKLLAPDAVVPRWSQSGMDY